MHRELEQRMCGMVRQQQPRPIRERAFTVNEVGWHNSVHNRMYVIIQDNVYDVTGEYALSLAAVSLAGQTTHSH